MATSFIFLLVVLTSFIVVAAVAKIRDAVDKKSIIATPSISVENAVITASASVRIKASVDEVFNFVIRYQDAGDFRAISQYKWQDVDKDGVPLTGSVGTFKMEIDPFGPRVTGVKLNVLDREKKRVSEVTTKYPPWLLSSERVQEVVPVPGHPTICEYRTYMTGQGLAAYYLLFAGWEELVEAQRQCAENVQAYFLTKRPPCPVLREEDESAEKKLLNSSF